MSRAPRWGWALTVTTTCDFCKSHHHSDPHVSHWYYRSASILRGFLGSFIGFLYLRTLTPSHSWAMIRMNLYVSWAKWILAFMSGPTMLSVHHPQNRVPRREGTQVQPSTLHKGRVPAAGTGMVRTKVWAAGVPGCTATVPARLCHHHIGHN